MNWNRPITHKDLALFVGVFVLGCIGIVLYYHDPWPNKPCVCAE